jgi:DNA end-binding protein Ku
LSKNPSQSQQILERKKPETAKEADEAGKPEEPLSETKPLPRRSFWSGTISVGLINVPVKLYAMIFDKGVSFRFLHKPDNQPLKYERVCTLEGTVVPWEDVAKGFEIKKNEYVVFDKHELEAAKPPSDRRIHIDKFVDYFSVDPHYFYSHFALMPNKSNESYSLLLTALRTMGKAGAGTITLRSKEYPALVHAYRGALVLTTMRYSYDVVDPGQFDALKNLEPPNDAELNIAKKIITDLSGEFSIEAYHDSYRDRVDELIQKKMKGEPIKVQKPPKEEVRNLMSALQETLKQLEKR